MYMAEMGWGAGMAEMGGRYGRGWWGAGMLGGGGWGAPEGDGRVGAITF